MVITAQRRNTICKQELKRYKQQKQSLEDTDYPEDQEEKKELLLKYYNEQIISLQALIKASKN